jgi:hypothetical protein
MQNEQMLGLPSLAASAKTSSMEIQTLARHVVPSATPDLTVMTLAAMTVQPMQSGQTLYLPTPAASAKTRSMEQPITVRAVTHIVNIV